MSLTCQSSKGDGYWSWRQIDGKRCWYKGKRRLSKSELTWGEAPKPTKVDTRPLPVFLELLTDPALAAPIYKAWYETVEREKQDDLADLATMEIPRYPDDPDPASVWPILKDER